MAEAAAEPMKKDDDHIFLKFLGADYSEVSFKARKTVELKKLNEAYANRQGVSLSSLTFLLDGRRIAEGASLEELEMEDGDIIEVYPREGKRDAAEEPSTNNNDLINLQESGADKAEIQLIVPKMVQLKKLKQAYEVRPDATVNCLRFILDGERIGEDSSPKELELEDGDGGYPRAEKGDAATEPAKKGDHFFLKVFGAGYSEIFEVNKTTPLKTLTDAYADHQSFMRELEMADGDVMRLYSREGKRIAATDPAKEEGDPIILKVLGADNSEVYFKVKKTACLKKLKQGYADHQGVSLSSLKFIVGGQRIADDMSPAELEMMDRDVIEVYPRSDRSMCLARL